MGVLAGVTAGVPHLEAATASTHVASPKVAAKQPQPAAFSGPVVAHVRDLSTGEIALMVGEREFIYRDPELVARLLNAAM